MAHLLTVGYADAIRAEFGRLADLLRTIPKPGVETILIEGAGDEFLLMRVGWHKSERLHNIVTFARLKDGKVWVEEDNTEHGIALELERAGVPREDIVLAFHHPETRKLGDYAVA